MNFDQLRRKFLRNDLENNERECVMEEDPVVTSFSVLNGDLLMFATKIYNYVLSLTNGNYMNVEKICKHGCHN
jgi:hypothetical protein